MRQTIDQYVKSFSANENEATATVVFDPDFVGFQGHFPDNPILPGVCQISLVLAVADRLTQSRQSLCEIVNAKFLSVVQPNQPLTVECSLANHILRAKLLTKNNRVAEFKLRVKSGVDDG